MTFYGNIALPLSPVGLSSNTAPVNFEFACKNKKEDHLTADESARSVGRQG